MAADGLASGIDNKISMSDANGIQRFQLIESFTLKEDATIDKKIAMDGTVRHPKFHQGWSGSFMIQREGDFTDAYFASQEANYYLGSDQIPITITQTITEANGTVSQYQLTGVVLTFENAGNYSGTEIVMLSVSFMAARRKNLSQSPLI